MPDVEILEAPEETLKETIREVPVHVGRSAQKRRKEALSLKKRLHHETRKNPSDGRILGPLRPCTVVNFNPIELVLGGVMGRFTVPAAGSSEIKRVALSHGGRSYVGQYMVLANPVIFSSVIGHEEDPQIAGLDVPKTVAKYLSPHAIGCELWHQYNSPSVKMMGGVLLFDQDVHWIGRPALERTRDKIWVPFRTQLEDTTEFSYDLRETLLQDELDRIFASQQGYCDVQIQTAHHLHVTNDPVQQAMITDTMRNWARYAKLMSWMEELPAWVSARVSAAGKVRDLKRCKYCSKQQANDDMFFCPGCNAPFDAFKAFLEGLHVPLQYLELLEGEQLETVQRILATRRRKFAAFADGESPDALPEEKPKTGKAAKARKDAE